MGSQQTKQFSFTNSMVWIVDTIDDWQITISKILTSEQCLNMLNITHMASVTKATIYSKNSLHSQPHLMNEFNHFSV